MIVSGLLGGLTSVGYILLLLFLLFYLYGIVGFYLYAANDPFHFGSTLSQMKRLRLLYTNQNTPRYTAISAAYVVSYIPSRELVGYYVRQHHGM
jgi:hypothetical protein